MIPGQKGFTLLELLLVLALLGLLVGLTGPNLLQIVRSMDHASKRQTVLSDLALLAWRAHHYGRGFVLAKENFGLLLADGNPMLVLPEGWSAELSRPVRFDFNGFCDGGQVTLRAPDSRAEIIDLEPPVCRPESHG